MLCAHTRECYMRTSYFILRVQNSLYTYTIVCTSTISYVRVHIYGWGGGGSSILFHQYDIVNICED